jgi:homoserine kinase
VRVPCSTSNLGAGFDCLGLALDRYLDAEYVPDQGTLRLERGGTLADIRSSPDDDLLLRAFRAGLAADGGTSAIGLVRATSTIPVARGLGSSAAATVAGLCLAALARGAALDRSDLLKQATQLEGHPDNAAPALFGGLVAVARDAELAPHAFLLPLAPEIGFVYAAPNVTVATADARTALPATVQHASAARMLGRMAALIRGLKIRDVALIRLGLLDELHVPYRLPLVAGAEDALAAAIAAGAWGATISGAGSGLLALCEHGAEESVLVAMLNALGEGSSGFVATPDLFGVRELSMDS